jgi:hypothetical protein
MFEFLRNLTKTDDERRQEILTAYLDDSLSPKDRRRFEQWLAEDDALRANLEQQSTIKEVVSQLPRVRVPRNFTLDPSLYGRPKPQQSLRLYPALRVATVFTVFVFVFLISIDIFRSEGGLNSFSTGADELALVAEEIPEEAGAFERSEAASQELPAAPEAEGEIAAAAPAEAAEEAAEEAVEFEDLILESEPAMAPLAPVETDGEQESAAGVDEPAEEREGVAGTTSPAEGQTIGAAEEADGATRKAVLPAIQTLVATRALDDQAYSEAQKTTEVETPEDEAALQPTPTRFEIPQPTPEMAEATVDAESAAYYLVQEPGDEQEAVIEEIPETRTDVGEDRILGLGALRLSEILLGVSVVLLIIYTLLLRRQVKKGP